MSAIVKKIRPSIDSTPKTIIGMLQGYSDQIKHIAAIVVWDDDSYQMVNDKMKLSEHAFAIATMHRALMEEMDKEIP